MPSTTNCATLLVPILLFLTRLEAQPIRPDSTRPSAETEALMLYHTQLGDESAIYNGLAYQPYDRGVTGTPYLYSANMLKTVIRYDGLAYDSISALYDLVRDELIIADPKDELITLYRGKVEEFTFVATARSFYRLTVDGVPGYYELLTPGKTSLYAKRSKKLEESIVDGQLHRFITSHDSYYLLKDGIFYPVHSKHKLLQLTGDKKKEIRQYESTHHAQDSETDMRQIVDYYNQLSR
jgi:hypothetical protein